MARKIANAPTKSYLNEEKGGRSYQITVFLIECVCKDALEEVVESLTEEGAVVYTSGKWRPIQELMVGLTKASTLAVWNFVALLRCNSCT